MRFIVIYVANNGFLCAAVIVYGLCYHRWPEMTIGALYDHKRTGICYQSENHKEVCTEMLGICNTIASESQKNSVIANGHARSATHSLGIRYIRQTRTEYFRNGVSAPIAALLSHCGWPEHQRVLSGRLRILDSLRHQGQCKASRWSATVNNGLTSGCGIHYAEDVCCAAIVLLCFPNRKWLTTLGFPPKLWLQRVLVGQLRSRKNKTLPFPFSLCFSANIWQGGIKLTSTFGSGRCL